MIEIVNNKGAFVLLGTIKHRFLERYYEWRLGIKTSGFITLSSMHDTKTNFGYEPVDYQSMKKILKKLDIGNGQHVFIDFGSGMGRAVFMAAMYPFHRVIGVELSDKLNSIAKDNLKKVKRRLVCKDVQIIAKDACHYEIPLDATVIFFFSPFGDESISKVMNNIHNSLTLAPRKLMVVFCNPRIFENVLRNNCEWLAKCWEFKRYDRVRVVCYANVPKTTARQ